MLTCAIPTSLYASLKAYANGNVFEVVAVAVLLSDLYGYLLCLLFFLLTKQNIITTRKDIAVADLTCPDSLSWTEHLYLLPS